MNRRFFAVFVLLTAGLAAWVAFAGSLEPPGPPAPTMKTLDEVEPRVPIRAADLPLTIATAGSYYFVEDIVTAGAGITVAANDVTLDLMGFSYTGGTDHGIIASVGTQGITVRNGKISGWSAHGVDLIVAKRALVSDIQAHDNGGNGIRVGESSAVTNCIAASNGIAGVVADSGSLVADNVIYDNTTGIQGLFGLTIARNSVYRNTGDGIVTSSAATVIGNTSYLNDDRGIVAGAGSTVIGNVSNANNDGIDVTGPSLIDQNTTFANADSNLTCAPGCVFGLNQDPTTVTTTLDDVAADVAAVDGTVTQTDLAVSGIDTKVDTLIAGTGDLQNRADPRTAIVAADLPLTVTVPGSYYLAEPVDTAAGGITVNASDVTLDLNGFTLEGGTGDGIVAGAATRNVTVRNGTVSGWAGDGVDLSATTHATAVDLRVDGNGAAGLRLGDDGSAVRLIAAANGGDGIVAGQGTRISEALASGNGGDGVVCSGDDCTVRDSTARANTGDGIELAGGALALHNTAVDNGSGGDGAGVHATGTGNRIDGNSVSGNDRGIDVDGTGNVVVRNVAGGNTADYDIAGGNDVGPLGTAASLTSPWGNVDD